MLTSAPTASEELALTDDEAIESMAEEAKEAGMLEEAELLYRKLHGARRALLGERHEETIAALDALGATLYMKNDLGGAQEALLEALAARREILGDEHADTVCALVRLYCAKAVQKQPSTSACWLRSAFA